MAVPPEIQDLVDRPRETPDIELKEWIDLSEPPTRAKTARHLAALANHGGGYFIIGIRDDFSLDPNHPGDLSSYSRDQIAGLVDRYLTPTFQCDVFLVTPSVGGGMCIVIRVPSHASVPICAKANGPEDAKGRIQGVRKGEHYVRMPGPKSVAIETPEQWQPVIRRCVMSERQNLLESFGRLLNPIDAAPAVVEASLKEWHDSVRKKFESGL